MKNVATLKYAQIYAVICNVCNNKNWKNISKSNVQNFFIQFSNKCCAKSGLYL